MGSCAGKPVDRPQGKENELRHAPQEPPKEQEKQALHQPQPTKPIETDKKPSSIVNPQQEEPKTSGIKANSAVKQGPSPKSVLPAGQSVQKQVSELIEKSKSGLIALKDSRADLKPSPFKVVEEEDEQVADEEVVNFRSDIVNFNLGVTVQ